MKLQGKVAVITGSSRGIGKATAMLFAKEGAKVVVNYRENSSAAEEVVKTIKNAGGEAVAIGADISVPEDVKRLFQEAKNNYGTVDILVNNAGAHNPKSFFELTIDDWESIFKTNVFGLFLCSQEASKIMMEQKGGRIVNVASVRGLFYCGRQGNIDYSASKSAVISITATLAKELAPYIRVTAVAPGPTDTDLSRAWDQETKACAVKDSYFNRMLQPEEVASTILFLASDDSSGITGEVVIVDGGYSLK